MSVTDLALPATRPLGRALRRGLAEKCPACGNGRLYNAYLKVTPRCATCGEDLSHERSDDAAPYITIAIVGHFVVAGILGFEEAASSLPSLLVVAGSVALAGIACLALLPRVKGAAVGLQWALRMHGFGG